MKDGGERSKSPLWWAYKADRALARAKKAEAEAMEATQRYNELMAEAEERWANRKKEEAA